MCTHALPGKGNIHTNQSVHKARQPRAVAVQHINMHCHSAICNLHDSRPNNQGSNWTAGVLHSGLSDIASCTFKMANSRLNYRAARNMFTISNFLQLYRNRAGKIYLSHSFTLGKVLPSNRSTASNPRGADCIVSLLIFNRNSRSSRKTTKFKLIPPFCTREPSWPGTVPCSLARHSMSRWRSLQKKKRTPWIWRAFCSEILMKKAN